VVPRAGQATLAGPDVVTGVAGATGPACKVAALIMSLLR
jgi:hypothetical protein